MSRAQRYAVDKRKAIGNVLWHFDRATAAQIADGESWYRDARQEAQDLADWTELPVDYCAVVLAHLSPQTRWSENKRHAWELLADGVKPSGAIGANVDRANRVMVAYARGEDLLSTFGPRAHKTRAFATAILSGGECRDVVIDVWAARAALQGKAYRFRDGVHDENAAILRRVGVYEQLADVYRIAARRRDVKPCTMQAAVWGCIRGSAD